MFVLFNFLRHVMYLLLQYYSLFLSVQLYLQFSSLIRDIYSTTAMKFGCRGITLEIISILHFLIIQQ